jgi:ferritin-like metal-binding protein YciE
MSQETLRELFVEQVMDLYDAEQQLVKALPKLAKAAATPELEEAIRNHLTETQNQVSRLEQVFQTLNKNAKGKTCKAMMGLIEEGGEAIKQEDQGPMRDLAIIAGAQRVEHYEISAYGTCRTLAERLGLESAVELLQETEDEESEADSKLSDVAEKIYDSLEEKEDDEERQTVSSNRSGSASGRARKQ